MGAGFRIVDLFAGPGGLAEGFSAFAVDRRRVFDIALSVEVDDAAFRTLQLRSFFRQFAPDQVTGDYFAYVAGEITLDQLKARHRSQWEAVEQETLQLRLGGEGAAEKLNPRLDEISRETGDGIVVVGGPPCQAYSLVGRSRNRGIAGYTAEKDDRYFLYQEYIRIVTRLQPVAFVMENVEGFLSAKLNGHRIFERVVAELEAAGGRPGSYRIYPLTINGRRKGKQYLLHAEKLGVPQCRHRVILLGVRTELSGGLDWRQPGQLSLDDSPAEVTVRQVLGDMPVLRSSLSKQKDGPAEWCDAAAAAFEAAAQAADDAEPQLKPVVARLKECARQLRDRKDLPATSISGQACAGTTGSGRIVGSNELSVWLTDDRLRRLPNHEARGHMASDLARYAFAAAFAEIFGSSPKAAQFPPALAPKHKNWSTGKFADRFRVQCWDRAATTVTSHIAKDGHYFIHPDPLQCRSLTVREAARLQTFPDNYFFEGSRTEQFTQVGNAVPPFLAHQIARVVHAILTRDERTVLQLAEPALSELAQRSAA